MPGEKQFIDFVNALDKKGAKQHDRVMRRTYTASDPTLETYVLFWKNPTFSDKSTAPYIAIDIHYKKGQTQSGFIGAVWAKDVKGVQLKPEQTKDSLAIPIANYLTTVNLSNPPPNPDELQDFDGDFNLFANRASQNLDAYQDGPGQRRR